MSILFDQSLRIQWIKQDKDDCKDDDDDDDEYLKDQKPIISDIRILVYRTRHINSFILILWRQTLEGLFSHLAYLNNKAI